MKNLPSFLPTTVIFVLLAFSWSGCSDTSGPEEEISPYSVYPASGSPGTVLSVRGVNTSGLDQDDLEVEIAGEAAPASIDDTGNIVTAVPMFFGPGGLPDPPIGKADIRIYVSSQLLAKIEEAVTITEFPVAPGRFYEAVTEMEEIADKINGIAQHLIVAPGAGEQYAFAFFAALDSLLGGDSEYSLSGTLGGQTEDSVAVFLLNGLYESNNLVGHLQTMSKMLDDIYTETGALRTGIDRRNANRPGAVAIDPFVVDDDLLALMMQVYVVMQIFGQEFIAETGTEFANTVGTIVGAMGLSGGFQGPNRMVAITQCILAYLDFVVNKVAIGFLPAHLDSLNLELEKYELVQGERTNAGIEAVASNEPPTITLNYLVGTTLTLLGLGESTTLADPMRQLLEDIAAFFLGMAQSALSQYAEANPELELDVELGSIIPAMTWVADVDDHRLLKCHSDNQNVVEPVAYELNWEASDVNDGYADIWVIPSMDSDAHVLPAVLPISYVGGAFGSDLTMSERIEVEVLGRLVLELQLPSPIARDGAGVLSIRAGYRESDGSITWSPDIDLAIAVTGGTPEESVGTTDSEGRFSTTVWADVPGAAQIDIVVRASGNLGSYREKEISAQIDQCGGYIATIDWSCPSSLDCGQLFNMDFCVTTTMDPVWIFWSASATHEADGVYYHVGNIGLGWLGPGGCSTFTLPNNCDYSADLNRYTIYLRANLYDQEPTFLPGGELSPSDCSIQLVDSCYVVMYP